MQRTPANETGTRLYFMGMDSRPTVLPTPPGPRPPRRPSGNAVTTSIQPHERGLLFHRDRFVHILPPGVYRLWERALGVRRRRIEPVSVLNGLFTHPALDAILATEAARAHFTVIDLEPHEHALVWIDERLAAVHAPGRYAYWNSPPSPHALRVERFRADEPLVRDYRPHVVVPPAIQPRTSPTSGN